MRRDGAGRGITALLGGAALVAVSACGGGTGPDAGALATVTGAGDRVTLGVGESVAVGTPPLRLTFEAIGEDSRCPVDVACVWEGDVAARFSASVGGAPSIGVELHTALEPREVELAGFRIALLGVLPVPRSGVPIPAESYRIRLAIERI